MSLQTARLIVLGETAVLVAAIGIVVVQYCILLFNGRKGMLPRHTLGIALSYLAFSVVGSFVIWEKWRTNAKFSGYTPCVGIASLVGLISVVMIVRHLREVRRHIVDQEEQQRMLTSGNWRSSRQLIVRTPSSYSCSTVWSSTEEEAASGAAPPPPPAEPLSAPNGPPIHPSRAAIR